jgi:hypothetical protein
MLSAQNKRVQESESLHEKVAERICDQTRNAFPHGYDNGQLKQVASILSEHYGPLQAELDRLKERVKELEAERDALGGWCGFDKAASESIPEKPAEPENVWIRQSRAEIEKTVGQHIPMSDEDRPSVPVKPRAFECKKKLAPDIGEKLYGVEFGNGRIVTGDYNRCWNFFRVMDSKVPGREWSHSGGDHSFEELFTDFRYLPDEPAVFRVRRRKCGTEYEAERCCDGSFYIPKYSKTVLSVHQFEQRFVRIDGSETA